MRRGDGRSHDDGPPGEDPRAPDERPRQDPEPADPETSEDAATDTALASPTARRSAPQPRGRGATIGRYLVLGGVGKGGMGTVLSAYDPELDRRVAIKLLRTRASPHGRKRLVREARALARLSHPNVVQVHDAGVHEGHVFVAMELVDGMSLRQWCARSPRPGWREVLRAYLEAARGIAAAHAKGLVHRDVKPSNILLGDDGRVRVADFGLAAAHERGASGGEDDEDPDESGDHAADDGDESAERSRSTPSGLDGRLEDRLTRTGTLMGTPAFMAPEQHAGAEVGAAADQYSFCASLYQGLYGQLPFVVEDRGRMLAELHARKLRGEVAPPPKGSEAGAQVPAWLHEVMVRGLAPQPEDRHPSMGALIAALEDDPAARRRARRRTAAMAAVTAALVGLAALGWMQREGPGEACPDPARELDGVWDEQVRGRIQSAFADTELPYAPDTFERVSTALDEYATSWVAMRHETCEATFVHKRQGDTIMHLRMSCLDRRRHQLATLAAMFAAGPDPDMVPRAAQAARSLPPLDYCADVEALTAVIPPPEDPAVRARVQELEARFDQLMVLMEVGRYREGLAKGETLLAEVAMLDHAPLRAQVMFAVARLKETTGDYAGAEALLRETVQVAATAREDVLVARVWARLVYVVGVWQDRHDDALALKEALMAAVARADDDRVRGDALHGLATVRWRKGSYDEARAGLERALAVRREALGGAHPDVGGTLINLANVLYQMGRYADARAGYERALEVWHQGLGPEHPRVIRAHNNLALVNLQIGNYEDARAGAARVLAIRERTLGPRDPDLGNSHNNLALVNLQTGKYDDARAGFERALAIWEQGPGADHPQNAHAHTGLGRLLVRTDELSAAARHLERARVIREEALGRDHPELALTLLGLGELALARGRPAAAVPPLERALALGATDGETSLALARALWAAGTDRARARALASEARDAYERLGHGPGLAEASRWLAEHRD